MSLSRRSFIETAALSAWTAQATEVDPKTGMPMRVLGRTGQKVSLLAFGSGSRWLMYGSPDKGIAAMEKALQSGVNYIDTAQSYGDGQSETWIGQMLKGRKKDFFLASKTLARTADDTMREYEASLKRLGVPHVDLLHIHSLGGEDDLGKIEAKGGVLEALYKLRDQKAVRFIGITCHSNPAVLKVALERHDFDSTQMALNVARMGGAAPSNKPGEGMTGLSGFEAIALPAVQRKKMGVTAMKVFAQEKLLGKAPVDAMLRYAMSLPVCAAVVGMPKIEQLEANIQAAKSFRPMSRSEMESLSDSVATKWKASIDRHFYNHADA